MAYNVSAWGSKFGVSSALFTSADASTAVACTDAPTTGEKLAIQNIIVSAAAAMEIAFEEETSGTEIVKFHMAQDSTVQVCFESPLVLPTAGKKLLIDTDTAGSVSATVQYYSTANGLP